MPRNNIDDKSGLTTTRQQAIMWTNLDPDI